MEVAEAKEECGVCQQLETYENILDHFCRAGIVIKTKVRNTAHRKVTAKKAKVLKGKMPLRKESSTFIRIPGDGCCHLMSSHQRYLIMGDSVDGALEPSLVLPWKMKTSKVFRKAVHMFNKFNCSDTTAIAKSLMGNGRKQNGKKGRRKATTKRVADHIGQ